MTFSHGSVGGVYLCIEITIGKVNWYGYIIPTNSKYARYDGLSTLIYNLEQHIEKTHFHSLGRFVIDKDTLKKNNI
tara:strand:+ start:70 stop:297 length:228 start_codon:yes stop_codon:yes gene_type:complete